MPLAIFQRRFRRKLSRSLLFFLLIGITLPGFRYLNWDTETWQDTAHHWLEDRQLAPSTNNLLLGSSTIKHLQPQRDLDCPSWLKRGIGNAHISDLLRYINYSPLNISPDKILLYAGENDLADNISLAQIINNYQQLLTTLHDRFPSAQLHLLSLKPSPKRAELHEEIIALNGLLKNYSQQRQYIYFHDANWENHIPKYQMPFKADGVHLSQYGYSLLTQSFNKYCETENRLN